MGYSWQVIAGPGTDTTLNGTTPVDRVDPYEDWEKVTRPEALKQVTTAGKALSMWQPVHVELLAHVAAGFAGSARALLLAIKGKDLAIGLDMQAILAQVAKLGNTAIPPAALMRLIVFRPEPLAYQPVLDGRGKNPRYRVLMVGPAVPAAFIARSSLSRAEIPDWAAGERGTEVVTAVIDDVTGIANERFRSGDGRSRIRHFWAQGMPAFAASGMPPVIGAELDKAAIDAGLGKAVSEEDFYRSLYPEGVPIILPAGRLGSRSAADLADPAFRRPFGFLASHGSHVLDLAAGYPMQSAPDGRPIVAVQLPQLATLETWGARLDLFILLGVMRILHWADNWSENGRIVRAPVVINISYGILAGPKDGSGFLEAEIARLVRARNDEGIPTAVALPAGNGYRASCHAEMALRKDAADAVTLRVQPEDLSVSFAEIWIDDLESASLTISPPVGAPVTLQLSHAAQVTDWQGDRIDASGATAKITIGRVYVRAFPGGRVRVVLALCPTLSHDDPARTAPPGAYGLDLKNLGTTEITARIEVQRDDTLTAYPVYGRQAYLDHPNVDATDPETLSLSMPRPGTGPISRLGTLSALATSAEANVVVVGGAFDRDALAAGALYSGAGPAGPRHWPDLSAVSEESRAHPGILASGTFSGSVAVFSGTSTAAPMVTRAIVDQWSSAPPAGTGIDVAALLAGGRPLPSPDPRLGAGIIAFAPRPDRPARRWRG